MNIATEIPVKNVVPNSGAPLNGDGEGSGGRVRMSLRRNSNVAAPLVPNLAHNSYKARQWDFNEQIMVKLVQFKYGTMPVNLMIRQLS